MAVSFVGVASSRSLGGTLSVNVPSGVQAGDLLIAHVASNRALVDPAGWTKWFSADGSSGSQFGVLYYRTATASEPASYALATIAGGDAGGAAIVAYRGAKVSAYAVTVLSSTQNPTAPSVATRAGDFVLRAFTLNTDLAAYPSGTTGLYSPNIQGDKIGVVGAHSTASSGTSGTATIPSSSFWAGSAASAVITAPNVAPNAPSLNSPPTNGTIDLGSVNRFAWTFSDPDAGDSQSKFNLYYRLIGAASWTVVSGTTPSAYYDFAAGTFAAGDYEWQAETYDSQGVLGARSTSSFFTAAAAPSGPTITAPVNGSTVSSSATVTWSAPNQTDYQVRRVADNAGAADTSTVYSDTGDVADSTVRSLPLTFPTNNRWEHIQVRIKNAGLWSTWADARVLVSFTPPATPTLVLTADSTTATITVAITNPTPGAGQPAVAYNDVYVDDDDGLGLVRKATMLATNATWTYRLPRSGLDYSTRIVVRAVATNGTTADSA